jgi:hypothetical protein
MNDLMYSLDRDAGHLGDLYQHFAN